MICAQWVGISNAAERSFSVRLKYTKGKKKRGPRPESLARGAVSKVEMLSFWIITIQKGDATTTHRRRKEQPSIFWELFLPLGARAPQLKNHTDPQIKFKIYFSPCPIMAIYGGICRLDIKKQVGTPVRPKFMSRRLVFETHASPMKCRRRAKLIYNHVARISFAKTISIRSVQLCED